MYIQMCLCICVMTLADFFTFLFLNKLCDPVSVYVMLYVIILIQILIRYNESHYCMHQITRFWPQNWKISLPWEGGNPPPRPSPRSVASLPRICHFSTRCPPPPQCVDPRYATVPIYTSIVTFDIKGANFEKEPSLDIVIRSRRFPGSSEKWGYIYLLHPRDLRRRWGNWHFVVWSIECRS